MLLKILIFIKYQKILANIIGSKHFPLHQQPTKPHSWRYANKINHANQKPQIQLETKNNLVLQINKQFNIANYKVSFILQSFQEHILDKANHQKTLSKTLLGFNDHFFSIENYGCPIYVCVCVCVCVCDKSQYSINDKSQNL